MCKVRGWASRIYCAKTVKYCKGVQHNYRLAKNTKKKELGTAHHNDASSTGYLITVMLHQERIRER